MKIDIENRMLIPFMLFSILPIALLAFFSYWNGYELLTNDKIRSLDLSLTESIAYIEHLDNHKDADSADSVSLAKEKALSYLSLVPQREIIILEGKQILMNHSDLKNDFITQLDYTNSDQVINTSDYFMAYKQYPHWNWTLIIPLDNRMLSGELLNTQKNMLLVAIVFLVLSMQAITFTAHSISKPIRKFADFCKTIEFNNLRQKIEISRSDEIGILANSFNHMIDQLNTSKENFIEMKQYSEDILRHVSIGILTTDNLGQHVAMNPSGISILTAYNNDPRILNALDECIQETIENSPISSTATTLQIETDQTLYFDVNISLLWAKNDEMSGAICCFNDITQRKVLENTMVRANRLASVGQFAAGLAHEIRNPLTGLKTGIQVIGGQMNDLTDSTYVELAGEMLHEIDRINGLVTELLDFSKPKQAKRDAVAVTGLIQKSLDILDEDFRKKKIQRSLTQENGVLEAYLDKDQIEQVCINIIKNSIDALDQFGQLDIIVDTCQHEEKDCICITFSDNGQGISESHLDRIFDPFFTTKSTGIGLGLSVVCSLVEENDGKLKLDSKVGTGTTIRLYFPRWCA